jgi:hypothetical protein
MMPTYSYVCGNGHAAEIRMSITEGPPEEVICKECGEVMEREYKIDEHVPKIAFNPWDVMYHEDIEKPYAEWRHAENKKQRARKRQRSQ